MNLLSSADFFQKIPTEILSECQTIYITVKMTISAGYYNEVEKCKTWVFVEFGKKFFDTFFHVGRRWGWLRLDSYHVNCLSTQTDDPLKYQFLFG